MEKDKGGQPMIVLSDDEVAKVEQLAESLSAEQIADFLGITRTTFRAMRLRDPRVDVAWARGRARMLEAVGASMIGMAREGDVSAGKFVLSALGGWKEQAAVEHSGGLTVNIGGRDADL